MSLWSGRELSQNLNFVPAGYQSPWSFLHSELRIKRLVLVLDMPYSFYLPGGFSRCTSRAIRLSRPSDFSQFEISLKWFSKLLSDLTSLCIFDSCSSLFLNQLFLPCSWRTQRYNKCPVRMFSFWRRNGGTFIEHQLHARFGTLYHQQCCNVEIRVHSLWTKEAEAAKAAPLSTGEAGISNPDQTFWLWA